MKDPICINETGGKSCGHPRSEHDSGGACKAAWCPCSRLVTESFIENAAPVPFPPERERTGLPFVETLPGCDVTDLRSNSEIDGPTATEHSAPLSEDWKKLLAEQPCAADVARTVPYPPVRKHPPDPLLAFNVETASFADLAVWGYKIQQSYREMKESSL